MSTFKNMIIKLFVAIVALERIQCVYQDPMSPFCQRISENKKRLYLNRVTLGKGSFGTVTQSSSKNVVKILDFKKTSKKYEKNFADILEEIIFMNDIKKNYPNVKDIQILKSCFYEDDEKNNILKFYLEQEKLKFDFYYMITQKKDWPMEWYLKMITQITNALKKMHSAGYAHLDVKPENIMMSDIETPVLIDFGFVEYLWSPEVNPLNMNDEKRRSHFTLGAHPKGSPKFIAPEIWYQNMFSFSSDFYALGVTIMDMLNPVQGIYNKSVSSNRRTKSLEMIEPLENVFEQNLGKIFQKDNNYNQFFLDLIRGLIKTDVAERFYVEDVLNELKKIKKNWEDFCKISKNKFLDVCSIKYNQNILMKTADELLEKKKKKVVLL